MLALAGVAAPAAEQQPAPAAPGVTVGGLAVGGFTSEDIRALLRRSLGAPLEFTLEGETWNARPDRLGASAAVDDAVARALHARTGTAVAVAASPRRKPLESYLRYLDRKLTVAPRDASLVGLDARLRPVIAAEAPGRRLDVRTTRAQIVAQLARAQREPVEPRLVPTRPKVTRATFGPVIVIRRGSNTLSLYAGSRLVRTFGVATGRSRYPTPTGTFSIADMQYNPWWYPPDSEWAEGLEPVPPGPGNPLGTRWMGLSAWGVGIHGTPDAASIGYSASHGCIRMRIPDAEWLFQHVHVGTPVVIVSA